MAHHPKRQSKTPHPALTKEPADSEDGRGRPAIVIDEEILYQLALTHASFEHMGVILGCSGNFLSKHPIYRGIIMKARAEKCRDLLTAQLTAAITDRNPTMLIWMGKQLLNQKDVQRVETTGADGKPQQIEHAYKAVAYFPENNRNKRLPSATVTAEDGTTEEAEVEEEYEVEQPIHTPSAPPSRLQRESTRKRRAS